MDGYLKANRKEHIVHKIIKYMFYTNKLTKYHHSEQTNKLHSVIVSKFPFICGARTKGGITQTVIITPPQLSWIPCPHKHKTSDPNNDDHQPNYSFKISETPFLILSRQQIMACIYFFFCIPKFYTITQQIVPI